MNTDKAFGAASINLNAMTTLTFTITNQNSTVALSGVALAMDKASTLLAGEWTQTPSLPQTPSMLEESGS